MTYRELTHKEQDQDFDKTINIARVWFARGFTTEQIARGIWNKIGYLCEAASKTSIKMERKYHGKNQKSFSVEIELS